MGIVLRFTYVFEKGVIHIKPIIGITMSENVGESVVKVLYSEAIVKAGGVPIYLPSEGIDHIDTFVAKIDGLLLTGGEDVDPTHYGEDPHYGLGTVTPKRDLFELRLVKAVLQSNKPILGICRGMQVINIVAGGSLYQDLFHQHKKPIIQHNQRAPVHHASHFIELEKDSLLQKIMDENSIKVNSFHHQAVKDVPSPFIVSARTSDGVIEAIESEQHKFVIGVQWHPEALRDRYSSKLFTQFIKESSGKI